MALRGSSPPPPVYLVRLHARVSRSCLTKVTFPAPGDPTTTNDPSRLLSPKLVETAKEQDHKTTRRHGKKITPTTSPSPRRGGAFSQINIRLVLRDVRPIDEAERNRRGWKPNLCRPATGSRTGNGGRRLFVNAVQVHAQTLSEVLHSSGGGLCARQDFAKDVLANCGD